MPENRTMLEELVQTIESRLEDLGRQLWCSPREELQEMIDQLAGQLQAHRDALHRSQRELTAARRRLHENPAAAALLHSRIENALANRQPEQAWKQALELDRLRQTLTDDQKALPRLELTCWSLQFLVRQEERHLTRLQGILSPGCKG
jgi:chromosome segregation ATPase